MTVTVQQIERFMALFQGSQRSFGQWNKKTGKMYTVKEPPQLEHFKKHLEGVVGIGIVPVARDRYSHFGAIDIEAEDLEKSGVSHQSLEATIREQQLPLATCRSKSGGAHLYLFRADPIPAPAIRQILKGYAQKVGFPTVEIFPKQDQISDSVLGNWINLPYFQAEKTERWFIQGGVGREFTHFLSTAEEYSKASIVDDSASHNEAPPCVQAMLGGQVPKGQRNEALYAIGVYLKKRYGDDFKQHAFDANARFAEPLEHTEAKKTISSIARRDYRYKCSQEPCRGLCDSNVCVTLKYGITPEEGKELAQIRKPGFFANLRKYNTEPVFWKLDVDGELVTVSTAVLMDFSKLRAAVADAHTRLIPKMKEADWHVILADLMDKAEILETPDEASIPGQVRAKLLEYTAKVSRSDSNGANDRRNLLRGMPIIEDRFGRRVVYFRGPDFVDFLKKSRSEELKGASLWLALRQAGVDYAKIKVEGQAVTVWYVDLNEEGELEFQPTKFDPEF